MFGQFCSIAVKAGPQVPAAGKKLEAVEMWCYRRYDANILGKKNFE